LAIKYLLTKMKTFGTTLLLSAYLSN